MRTDVGGTNKKSAVQIEYLSACAALFAYKKQALRKNVYGVQETFADRVQHIVHFLCCFLTKRTKRDKCSAERKQMDTFIAKIDRY